ncbi:MAG: pyruvate kinase [Campylobacterales bacterium]|nr:pyruvate kinase [Campylobacterales bacterium]
MRKTKIVSTLGPATDSFQAIEQLIQTGVNVFRLNFSHATYEYHRTLITKIRKASAKIGKEVAILQDVSGPKIRICHLKKPMELEVGDIITLSKETIDETTKTITISYPEIIDTLQIGDQIFFSDGTIRAKVIDKNATETKCEITVAQTLNSRKGVNFPDSHFKIDAITPKDKQDLEFGAKNDIDLVALSFVHNENDINIAKSILEANGANPLIFAKIETDDAVANIEQILEAADGIMVARGDLGVELGLQKVPSIQKKIIKAAAKRAKPSIVATQMLTSMIDSPYPTRAEISDIANAVLDGCDAVMLSDETTIGKYPNAAVQTLHNTIMEIEKDYPYFKEHQNNPVADPISAAVITLAQAIEPDALIAFSRSGKSAMSLAALRPKQKILVKSQNIKVLRKLQVIWGIDAILLSQEGDHANQAIKEFLIKALDLGMIALEKKYIMTIGFPFNFQHPANDIKLLDEGTMRYLLDHN